jgi:hypothetical protein
VESAARSSPRRRLVAVLARWQSRRWLRVSPGRRGLSVLAGLPTAYALPLERVFSTWWTGSVAVTWLGAFAMAATLGRDSGRPSASLLWTYQKGIPRADYVATVWLLDASLGLGLLLWWAAVWVLVGVWRGEAAVAPAALLFALGALTFLIAHAFLLVPAAAGSSRGVDLLVLLGLVSLLEPLLARLLSPAGRALLHVAVPPFQDALQVTRGLADGVPLEYGAEWLHVTVFLAAGVAVGLRLASRRAIFAGRA